MVKVKKSFFEKLTGSRRIDDEEEEFERRDTFRQEPSVYSEEEAEMMITPSSERQPVEERATQSIPQEDGEGQLTIDVYQTDNDIIIKSTIAGVKPEDLDVSINNDMLTIRGERKQEEEISQEDYYYQECYWGGFSRSVILPVDVLPDKVEASMKNGILTIKLPKADTTKAKKIQVRGF